MFFTLLSTHVNVVVVVVVYVATTLKSVVGAALSGQKSKGGGGIECRVCFLGKHYNFIKCCRCVEYVPCSSMCYGGLVWGGLRSGGLVDFVLKV